MRTTSLRAWSGWMSGLCLVGFLGCGQAPPPAATRPASSSGQVDGVQLEYAADHPLELPATETPVSNHTSKLWMGGAKGAMAPAAEAAPAAMPELAEERIVIDGSRPGGRTNLKRNIAPVDSAPGQPREYKREDTPQRAVLGGSDYFADDLSTQPLQKTPNTEDYDAIVENPFHQVLDQPLSTFSVDVDTASYANVRRFLNQGQLPPAGAVRIEELVNYFSYNDAPPTNHEPFAVHAEVAGCPWNPAHRLVRFGLKGRVIEADKRPLSNLVFLLDVSGSMNQSNKLPLVKESLKLLTKQLGENDRVGIVVYAGASGLALPSVCGNQQPTITEALDRLAAGGSTNGGEGLQLAYNVAEQHKIPGGVNRVILCTDGDFNVGTTNRSELVQLVTDRAKAGISLTVLGFGMGNLKDSTMEQLADKGNGNYGYIDTLHEAQKMLVDQINGTLVTIAKDVKIQVEFNPRVVAGYRLIGYENRMLAAEDFRDDKKDAGEIGAGHTVTALYEVVPAGGDVTALSQVDPLRYQQPTALTDAASSSELLTLKLRYKAPDGDVSSEIKFTLKDGGAEFAQASEDFRFAASVAAFGLLLRNSAHKGEVTLPAVLEWASQSQGADRFGYRREFVDLVRRTGSINSFSMR